jgi:hypothetical protein
MCSRLILTGYRIHRRLQERRLFPTRSSNNPPGHQHPRQNHVTSSHTINQAELVGIDIGMQLGHEHLLNDNACSILLFQGHMHCPTSFRYHIHRETFKSITNNLRKNPSRCWYSHTPRQVKTHNSSYVNGLADALANQVADGKQHDASYSTGS